MSDPRQAAIELTQTAVRNLRRNLSLGFSTSEPTELAQRVHAQQRATLVVWEYMLAIMSLPVDPAIEIVQRDNTRLIEAIVDKEDEMKVQQVKIEMLQDKLKQFRHDEAAVRKLRDLCVAKRNTITESPVINDYITGVANGLILAVSCFDPLGKDPVFLEHPDAEL